MIKSFCFNSDDELISNTYVIGNKNSGCYIIDLGKFDTRIEKYIKEFHNNTILAVLLTHGHFDHIAGLNQLFEKGYYPTIFISSEDDKLLDDTRLNCSNMSDGEVLISYNKKIIVEDGDEINFGDFVVKVIQTSGHTEGSVCYLIKQENALFSGDTLFKDGIGRCDLPTGSIKDMRVSLDKLSKLDENLKVYPGHGDPTTIKKESKNIGGKL